MKMTFNDHPIWARLRQHFAGKLALVLVLSFAIVQSAPQLAKFKNAVPFYYPDGTVTVINKASKDITDVAVTVCEKSYNFGDLKRGARKTFHCAIQRRSAFSISARFASGRTVAAPEIGYVTPSIPTDSVIFIEDNDIKCKL